MKFDFHVNHRLLFGTAGAAFVALSVLVAVAPAAWLQRSVAPLPGSRALTSLERQGLEVYLSEGCVYCHTQQVRPLQQDTSRYGRASVAADYARLRPMGRWHSTPRVLGTERTGPDLTNIGARQPSAIWHGLHLFQPRAVVPGSIMPAFPWLFQVRDKAEAGTDALVVPAPYGPGAGVVVPTERGRALIAYLLALQSAPLPQAASSTNTQAPPVGASDAARGERIYSSNCAACHQPTGQGIAGTFPPFAGDSVVLAEDAERHIEIVLFGNSGASIGGVTYASPMPAWGALLSDEEVAAVINHERRSWGNAAPQVTVEAVAALRARGARHVP
ncbi:MAG: cbb3-type cytochrome c oxidase subunit II [Gemmatimonadota bacterium]